MLTYDANGNRETATFANGVKLTCTYDDLNRLILQQMVDNSGKTVAQYQYTFGKNGERTHIEEEGSDETFFWRELTCVIRGREYG